VAGFFFFLNEDCWRIIMYNKNMSNGFLGKIKELLFMRVDKYPKSKKKENNDEQIDGEGGLLSQVNRELYKRNAELAIRNKTLALLRKLDEVSMTSIGMEDMSSRVTIAIGQELGYELAAISVFRNDNNDDKMRWLSVTSPVSEINKILKKKTLDNFEESLQNVDIAKEAMREHQAHVIDGYSSVYPVSFVEQVAKTSVGKNLKSSLIYPLSQSKQALGVLILTASRDLNNLSQYEREAISGIIGLVSLAIYKSKIYEDLQKTTEDLREANDRLAQLDKAKSEFLSIASHQLYTPLTAIKGYLSMVQEGDYGKVSVKQQPIMEILYQSSERLIELIKNLLDVSRIESGRLELSLRSVDLAKMAQEIVTELSPNAKKKNLVLNFHQSEAGMPHVVADSQRIRQVVLNVVDNAIKYTNSGQVDVRVIREDDFLTFSVQDTGKGVTAEDIGRLFVKFTRVGGAEKYHTDGSGLGLYVARKICREHHGDIWVDSPGLGRGSTFFVRLPIEGSKDALPVGTNVTVGYKPGEN
jgi:signal transduction histidine kinase